MKIILNILLIFTILNTTAQTDKLFALLETGNPNLGEVKAAIKNGANINAEYTEKVDWMYGLSPVHIAAAFGNVPLLELLVENKADLHTTVKLQCPEGYCCAEQHHNCTPLQVAVFYWNDNKTPAMLDYLLKNKLDINGICYGGQTPLMYALMSLHTNLNTIKYLVEHGADVKKLRSTTNGGESVLYYCLISEVDKSKEAEYLMQKGAPAVVVDNYDKWDLLAQAIYFGENQFAKLFLKYKKYEQGEIDYLGYPINDDNSINVNNYLHFAIYCKNYSMVKALLDAGFSPDSKIKSGQSALDLANETADKTMINLLKTKQLPVKLDNWYNLTESSDYTQVKFRSETEIKPFSIKSTQGVNLNNASFKGKVVLLNFWATWCGYCLQEMPSMDALAKHLGGTTFKVFAVSVDNQEDRSAVDEFIKKNNYSFVYACDPDKKIFDEYSSAIPGTYLLDKQGKIVARVDGAMDWNSDKMRKLVETIIQLDAE